mmetsp:Transcript_10403/g.19082  ORF Transcript_10403/g.19082 Transcript_10403/m.19082 type:complete len:175 (-) Transcript_10403:283-807(-)
MAGLQVRDYPPPCRHTKASAEKDVKIKALEAQMRKYEEQIRLAEEIADEYREEVELEKLKSEHQQAVIEFQQETIRELEDVLAQQQALVDAIFADPKATDTAARQERAGEKMEGISNRVRLALNRRGRTDGQGLQGTAQKGPQRVGGRPSLATKAVREESRNDGSEEEAAGFFF